MATYQNTGQYDLVLESTRQGWHGTFNVLLRTAAKDILSDGGPYGPVEVTYPQRADSDSSTVLFGTLVDSDDNTLFIDTADGRVHSIEIDAVERFRA